MRIFVTQEDSDLAALAALLFRKSSAKRTALAQLKALNPQISDIQRLKAGTLLVLPETKGLKPNVGTLVRNPMLAKRLAAAGSAAKESKAQRGEISKAAQQEFERLQKLLA